MVALGGEVHTDSALATTRLPIQRLRVVGRGAFEVWKFDASPFLVAPPFDFLVAEIMVPQGSLPRCCLLRSLLDTRMK